MTFVHILNIICFGLVVILVIGFMAFCVVGISNAFKDNDEDFWFEFSLWSFLLITSVIVLCYCISSAIEEGENPCVAWGAPQTYWMFVGKVAVPTTYTPCIRRQNEVEK